MANPFIPESIKTGLTPKQAEFLCYEGREALFGGASGGGKSSALLCAALQWVAEPTYSALILRRTFKQLAKADSILNKSKEWLTGKARWKGDEHKWTFPSGATLEFGHMEHDGSVYDYQGGIWPFIGVDEATQFTGEMLAYPRTRQRRPAGSRIPIRWRGASNPGGVGHDAVKHRYVKAPDGTDPATPDRQFFPARLEDNPNIDAADYVRQLQDSGVDPLTLEQLLKGDWDAVPGGRFRREWIRRYRPHHAQGYWMLEPGKDARWADKIRCIFQTCDPASSAKQTADYTVLATWGVSLRNELMLLDVLRVQKEVPDLIPLIEASYRHWKPMYVAIEAVAANSAVYQFCARTTMVVRPLNPMSQDKLVRASPATVLASAGRLYLPQAAPWLEAFEGELLRFTGDEKQDAHDDCVDVLSYAVGCLDGLEQPAAGRPFVYQGKR